MKKLINNPRHVLREMLEGFVDLHSGLALLEEEAVVVRADLPVPASRPIALLSGGGSGHEPAHAGYVGPGLLAGAIAGDVFTSPSVDAVLAGIRAAAGPLGAVLVVKNYTGDRLNFGLAAELAQEEGIPVEIVVVADDVALRDTVEPARRRGIAGTVLIHKLAGATIAAGRTLAEVAAIVRAAAADLGTMGVALGACIVPTAGKPGFTLGDSEIELGLGIHGEAGVRRGPLQPADELVAEMLQAIVSDRGLARGDRVALLINGLGATPPMELSIVARAALADLAVRGIAVERAWAGNFLTALDMPGCSLSLLKLDDERIALLDAPAQAPAWPGGGKIGPKRRIRAPEPAPVAQDDAPPSPLAPALQEAGLVVADALVKAEPHLTDLDARAGDGDLGASMVRAAEAIRALPDAAWADPSRALASVGDALRRAIGGSSGPFYATALLRASRRLAGDATPAPAAWAEAFTVAVQAIGELGGAKPGDRTMLDALHPATEAFSAAVASGKSPAEAWGVCVAAAAAGTDATARMLPRLGRASYLGERAIGLPDAGAAAVLVWLEALKAVVR
ncbi:dihydroxyacetone kinase subunit DhaK [Mycobacterium sp. KBS0706]|uniref:dihydroxyacetone kinase family protein n=1 Tax=Mycobacterium sp. KBS0706 TaxID=2578109 RepID=UPI00110FD48D|nr:dihydroxyacetone kinase family protein [Mycobacterium sp. KBS0706]TSD86589.1 dihydroxyacetone kinase subunit DhaK [Mycobacterium sp. KBS0706]